MTDLDLTLRSIVVRNWVVVLLAPRSKRPEGVAWYTTGNPSLVRHHIEAGGNLGLMCGKVSGVAVLDFDDTSAAREMMEELGPLPLAVITGSGKWHTYFQYQDDLPPKIFWRGEKVGEVQRGPNQQVVMPPSVHPDTGQVYSWAQQELPEVIELPLSWLDYLRAEYRPSYVALDRRGHPEEEPWTGPPPEELLRRALAQPGARRRRNGVKFQCPGCRDDGHDRSRDNALVGNDGRWGCAVDPGHKRDIGVALGASENDDKLAEDQDIDRVLSELKKTI
jgi:bifunctional DNA primase/polymerase-like protein